MTALTLRRPSRVSGFTLIELIAVVVLLGIAGAAIMRMQGNLFNRQAGVTDLQVYSRLQAECADVVLSVQRQDGIDEVANGIGRFEAASGNTAAKCDTLAAYTAAGVTYPIPSVSVADASSNAMCPAATTCKMVTITAGSLQPLVFMLANY